MGDKRLIFTVKRDKFHDKINAQNFDAVQQAMRAAGINMRLEGDTLYISVWEELHRQKTARNAGRRKKIVHTADSSIWRYSDVVYMLQTMTDQQIYTVIGMASSTYYRHKKDLMQSDYYNSLDKARLEDKMYLESVTGNFAF